MGAKKSLTGEEMEQQEEQDALQKIAEAEALAVQQSGNNVDSAETKCTIIVRFVNYGKSNANFQLSFIHFSISEAIAKEQSKNKESQSQVKEILQERLDLYKVEIDENELNLRRNIILGGVFYFDMLQIPPQPKRIANWIICQLETPQVLFFFLKFS